MQKLRQNIRRMETGLLVDILLVYVASKNEFLWFLVFIVLKTVFAGFSGEL